MKKLKKIFNKLGKKYTEYSKKYLITNIAVILFTLYLMIFGLDDDKPFTVARIFIMIISSSLLVETMFDEGDKKRLPLYALSVLLSIILPIFLKEESMLLTLIYIGIVGILLSLTLYLFINRNKSVERYFVKLFYNLFKVGLFTLILIIGFGIIYIVAETLILEGYNVEFYSKVLYFLMGAYTVPFTIIGFYDTKDDIPDFIHTLINRVLLVLLDISYVIIILYMLKMFITTEIPRNEVFLVVVMLFLFTIPMVVMLSGYKGKIEQVNSKALPYILMVPVILQTYALAIRIYNYGVTTVRYAGIFIVIFEILTLVLLLLKDKKYFKYVFLAIPGFIFVMFILPIANVYEAPIYMQVSRLQGVWKENSVTSEFTALDRQKIKDIYEYLREHEDVNRYMPKYLSMDTVNEYLMNTRGKYEEEAKHFTYRIAKDEIIINGYSKLEEYTYSATTVKYGDLSIEVGEDAVNVYDELNKYLLNDTAPESLEFTTSKGKIIIKYIDFVYNDKEEIFENIDVEAYILHK